MKIFQVVCLLLGSLCLSAQKQPVELLNREELLALCSTHNDTTYVINFWATWCKPCIEELPYFEALHRVQDAPVPIKVILVSLDFEENLSKRVIPFLEKNQIQAKVCLVTDTRYHSWIDEVDNRWSGAIPATLVLKNHEKHFAERSFASLQDLYDFVHP